MVIDVRIKWPVTISHKYEPEFGWDAPNLLELGRYVEFWNCSEDEFPDEHDEDIVLTDALGRKLDGRIERLDVVELFVASGSDVNLETQ